MNSTIRTYYTIALIGLISLFSNILVAQYEEIPEEEEKTVPTAFLVENSKLDEPIEGVKIKLVQREYYNNRPPVDFLIGSFLTDKTGRVVISLLPDRSFLVTASKDGFSTQLMKIETVDFSRTHQNVVGLSIRSRNIFTISGKVEGSYTNAKVILTNLSNNYQRSSEVEKDGSYEIKAVRQLADYKVQIEIDGNIYKERTILKPDQDIGIVLETIFLEDKENNNVSTSRAEEIAESDMAAIEEVGIEDLPIEEEDTLSNKIDSTALEVEVPIAEEIAESDTVAIEEIVTEDLPKVEEDTLSNKIDSTALEVEVPIAEEIAESDTVAIEEIVTEDLPKVEEDTLSNKIDSTALEVEVPIAEEIAESDTAAIEEVVTEDLPKVEEDTLSNKIDSTTLEVEVLIAVEIAESDTAAIEEVVTEGFPIVEEDTLSNKIDSTDSIMEESEVIAEEMEIADTIAVEAEVVETLPIKELDSIEPKADTIAAKQVLDTLSQKILKDTTLLENALAVEEPTDSISENELVLNVKVVETNSDSVTIKDTSSYLSSSDSILLLNKDTLTTQPTQQILQQENETELAKEKVYERLEKLNFNFLGKSLRFSVLAAEEFNKVVSLLNSDSSIIIQIEVYTDARRDNFFNWNLTRQRAQLIKNKLLEKGIDKKQFIIKYKGESNILNHCEEGVVCTDAQHNENNRVEITVLSNSK